MFGFRKIGLWILWETPNYPKMAAILGEFGVWSGIQQCSKSDFTYRNKFKLSARQLFPGLFQIIQEAGYIDVVALEGT
jgi:hypothetical protein